MKRSKTILFLTSVLLLFVMAFSFAFALLPRAEECEHSVCDYCMELETEEMHLQNEVQAHQECQDDLCIFCGFIQLQRENLQEKKSVGHECHATICFSCMSIWIAKRARALLCIVIVCIAVEAVIKFGYCAYTQKKNYIQDITLVSLKVKLTN